MLLKLSLIAVAASALAGCGTPEQNRIMGQAMAKGMQSKADAHNRAAQATPVYVPKQQNCYVHPTSQQHATVMCR